MYQRLVVGTDGSDTAANAVRHALGLARVTSARVHLVTAWSRLPALALAGGSALSVPSYGDDGAWVEELHRQVVAQAREYGVRIEPHAVEAAPAHALLDVAEQVRADLIVVGNRGMAGLRGRLGSVPNTVAHQARCAVLVVPTG